MNLIIKYSYFFITNLKFNKVLYFDLSRNKIFKIKINFEKKLYFNIIIIANFYKIDIFVNKIIIVCFFVYYFKEFYSLFSKFLIKKQKIGIYYE